MWNLFYLIHSSSSTTASQIEDATGSEATGSEVSAKDGSNTEEETPPIDTTGTQCQQAGDMNDVDVNDRGDTGETCKKSYIVDIHHISDKGDAHDSGDDVSDKQDAGTSGTCRGKDTSADRDVNNKVIVMSVKAHSTVSNSVTLPALNCQPVSVQSTDVTEENTVVESEQLLEDEDRGDEIPCDGATEAVGHMVISEPVNNDTKLTDHEDTDLAVKKETLPCETDPRHGDIDVSLKGYAVLETEKVSDVTEKIYTMVETEEVTDISKKSDVVAETGNIDDNVKKDDVDADIVVSGDDTKMTPTDIVNETKPADCTDHIATTAHSEVNEQEMGETMETNPRSFPDISVSKATGVHSEVVAMTTETSASCQCVTGKADMPWVSAKRTSPVVTVSDVNGQVIDMTPFHDTTPCHDTDVELCQLERMTANLHLSAASSTSTPLNCRSAPFRPNGDMSLATQLDLDMFANSPEKGVKGHHLRSLQTVSLKDGDYKAKACHRDGSFLGQCSLNMSLKCFFTIKSFNIISIFFLL